MSDLTVLLVTMDRRDLLEMALWYLWETCAVGREADVWVWDNASTDDTPEFLGTIAGWLGVRVFRSRENVGLSGAHRRMLPHVRTRHVFTLDDDVWLLNRGWAAGVSRVLDGDAGILCVSLGPDYHLDNDFGVEHVRRDRPHFRVPPVAPGPRMELSGVDAEDVRVHGYGYVRVDGTALVKVGGEHVVVPAAPVRQLPFGVSGSAAAWRTEDVQSIVVDARHPVVDLREVWSFPLQERGLKESAIIGYGVLHPSPGPVWHLGRGERYWERRCGFSEAIYGRPAGQQRRWLEVARAASGWGSRLEDPDEVLGL